ncbi:hypothetical protein WJX82_002639 [Trebouxia sp. C0006]
MHLRPVQVSFDPAFKPFSSPGTRKASARCACSASVGLAPPEAEDSKANTHTVAGTIRGLLPAGTLQAAETTLGQRTQANNILPGRSQLRQVSQSCHQHAQAKVLGKSSPGRPKGKPAWNKGRSMSASAKQQISKSQKNRWKQQPALRGLVSSKLKGKEPWNKGQRLDQGICDKMSAAKQGHTVPRSVCAKMSRSHAGLRPSQASRAAMSQAASGVAKTAEHKAKIAAAQRRRHAAARALTAVEAFHRGSDTALPSGSQSPNQSSPGKGKGRRSSVRCLSGRSSQGKSLTKTQIMTAYKAELREYRLLQEELGPWTQAFKAQHGRKPGLLDVERTGIEWLLDKFKAYVILRDRLLSDTSILRDKLEVAAPEVANGQSNANASTSRPTGMKAARSAAVTVAIGQVRSFFRKSQNRENRRSRIEPQDGSLVLASNPFDHLVSAEDVSISGTTFYEQIAGTPCFHSFVGLGCCCCLIFGNLHVAADALQLRQAYLIASPAAEVCYFHGHLKVKHQVKTYSMLLKHHNYHVKCPLYRS